jgi:hypothetical protein
MARLYCLAALNEQLLAAALGFEGNPRQLDIEA